MRNLLQASVLTVLLGLTGPASSLGLGDIAVDTALNKPLRAEIDLLAVRPEDLEDMRVSLASQNAFDRVGLARPFALTKLQFEPTLKDGRPVIEVRSDAPIREPFLNFLVEVRWPKGRLLREYTVLLDPPVFAERPLVADTQAPTVDSGAAQAPQAQRPQSSASGAPGSVRAKPARAAQAPVAPSTGAAAAGSTPPQYTVVRGDTLTNIVASRLPADGSVNAKQMMLAVLRANPDAFIDGNINSLKSGVVLRFPQAGEIRAVAPQEADVEVARQNALWREYRARLAETQPQSAGSAPPEVAAGGDLEAEPAPEEGAAQLAADRLEILAANETAGQALSGAQGKALSEADAVTRELAESRARENEELRARLQELETIVSKQERLITLQSEDLHALQERLAAQDAQVSGASQNAASPQAAGLTAASAQAPASATASSAEGAAPASSAAEDSAQAKSAAPALAPSLLDELLANPGMLMAAGSGLLLLAALAWLVARRIAVGRAETVDLATYAAAEQSLEVSDTSEREASAMLVADESAQASEWVDESEAASTAETAWVDESDDASVEELEAAQRSPAEIAAGADAHESDVDDTLAEADVFIAYGLHEQAEDLLRRALDAHPQHPEYRLKLLEAYHGARNKQDFERVAAELHDQLGGRASALWDRAVAMGQEISPGHALFSGAGVDAQTNAEPSAYGEGETTADDEAFNELPESSGVAQPEPSSAPADEALELDIDLDPAALAGELEGDAHADSGEGKARAYDTNALEFDVSDLAFDDDSQTSAQPAGSASSADSEEDALELDFSDLELGADAAADELAQPQAGAEEENAVDDDDVFSLNEWELEDDAEPAAELPAELWVDEASDAAVAQADEQSLELDPEPRDEPSAHERSAQLDSSEEGSVGILEEAGIDIAALQDAAEAEAAAASEEVGTKLDLAQAYLDMGDSDGARSTLEEVLDEGDTSQREFAESLLKRIA